MEQSVKLRAEAEVPSPEDFLARAQKGVGHYTGSCVVCHGTPGVERGEVGKGLTPEPPSLTHAAREFNRSELFWIVKHGIKMTGMPAFGETHSDEGIWNLVALVELLPQLTSEEYDQMVQENQTHSHQSAHSARE